MLEVLTAIRKKILDNSASRSNRLSIRRLRTRMASSSLATMTVSCLSRRTQGSMASSRTVSTSWIDRTTSQRLTIRRIWPSPHSRSSLRETWQMISIWLAQALLKYRTWCSSERCVTTLRWLLPTTWVLEASVGLVGPRASYRRATLWASPSDTSSNSKIAHPSGCPKSPMIRRAGLVRLETRTQRLFRSVRVRFR